ncbi:peptide ABC transporter substrate-binding protein [Tetragenococcus osmophilus]|uniref:ABC transporter substrate-binding protein n=1 Tax=Tetragenococcus osmophilus TaxID=526944 RepID=A0AA37XIU3_9ENTE|nr:tryptophan ABC transporter substrate-binding protein [Tetragenococcus osmophilus]AYW48584.1 peptide ABC transporter substrate-binding protein [Tetragenococcus osmophilus]GMA54498.1 ABC transporter substrate-binding protein [Alicyclobacillus contaminans]GMA71653.1 ABC transporter substrate-binding protein [Tetragenococcus osmophilus]
MKNRGLILTIIVLFAILITTFVFEVGKSTSETESNTDDSNKTVGILQYVSHPALNDIRQGVEDGLEEAGYKQGENLTIEYQNGQADQSNLDTMSQQLVQQDPDALVGIATPAAQSLANTTQDIPTVLGAVTDPVGANLVDDMQEPGGNLTGVSDKAPVDQQMELTKELLPDTEKIGILYSSTEDNSKYQVAEAREEAENSGFEVETFPVPSTNEISQTVQTMTDEVDTIYVPLDNTIANAMPAVVNEANKTETPIIPSVDTMVEQGGLATISVNQYDLGVKSGEMVADILDGNAEPATTPIYTFDTGDIIINEEQAEKLNIELPDSVKEDATYVEEDDE